MCLGRLSRVAAAAAVLFLIMTFPATTIGQLSEVRVEVHDPDFIPLHSYCIGEHADRLIFFGGISKMGMHSLNQSGEITFPIEVFNPAIHVYELATGSLWSASTATLPDDIQLALLVTNAAAFQQGDHLYLYGGYGPNLDGTNWGTRPAVTEIDLVAVHDAVVGGTAVPASAFSIISSEAAQVAGAAIVRLGERFALIGGSKFRGNYGTRDDFSNTYRKELQIFDPRVSWTAPVEVFSDPELRRRDMNASPITIPVGGTPTPGLAVHTGVFQPDAPLPWDYPILYADGQTPYLDTAFYQRMNQYTAPRVSLYSERLGRNCLLTFGGLSSHMWDGAYFVPNFAIPWVDEITQLTVENGFFVDESVIGEAPKAIVDAEFVVNPDLPTNAGGQILLDGIPAGETLLGYYLGGVVADQPANAPPTTAGRVVYAVYATVDHGGPILVTSDFVIGEVATMTVEGAEPGARVAFAYSLFGAGPTFVPSIGMEVDLSRPIYRGGHGYANSNGTVSIVRSIPDHLSPRPLWIQAVMAPANGDAVKTNLVKADLRY
ncbi:MAG: hypothetical protein ACF8PN_15285 [Phycisphaerales bacterium]